MFDEKVLEMVAASSAPKTVEAFAPFAPVPLDAEALVLAAGAVALPADEVLLPSGAVAFPEDVELAPVLEVAFIDTDSV